MSSNRSSTLSSSLPPTPDDSRPTSSMSLYSNTSSVYYQPQPHPYQQQQPGYNMVYDHRHSVVNYNTHIQRHFSSHHHHHNNNNSQDNMYQYEILDHEVNYPQSLLHKPSISTIGSNFTQKLHVQQQNLRKQATTRGIYQQQQQQQEQQHQQQTKTALPRTPVAKQKKMPLFPTVRTRGSSSIQEALRPVDVTQIELMPIEFSHKIVMSCIDEIKLRGLKHKHLFRNAFYSPSVESALTTMIHSKRTKDVFSVNMMRMDTVGGLLTTALSRTYPPLIPPHIRELFENPKGRFFFELLSLLPELNRFLFVEILDLCCDLVDHQAFNHVSHSKLAIYPGSCCFGLDEYMPTWDTRYLMTPDLKKFSNAFYQVIYAYREERDLTAEELQHKLDARERQLEQDRWVALEHAHGLVGAAEILKMEARIAQGLPAESPVLPPSDMKEISLYADRKEVVVADDAISVFDMPLGEDEDEDDGVPYAYNRPCKAEAQPEEENIEQVTRDLRRSVSVASMGQPTSIKIYRESQAYRMYAVSTRTYLRATRVMAARPTPVRTKSIARFSSIHKHVFPVSPGDIMGFSRNAVQQKELQDFLTVARTTTTSKKRKAVSSKKIVQLRVQNRLLRRSSRSGAGREKRMMVMPCVTQQQLRRRNSHQSMTPWALPNLRRGRNRQLRKELEVYLAKGLSQEEAAKKREMDIKKEKRRTKKAKQTEKARAVEAAKATEVVEEVPIREAIDMTMEEAEILEAFDYLSDQEFAEFMELAGLTMADVDHIREKSAAAALSQVTKDIHRSGDLNKGSLASASTPPVSQGTVATGARVVTTPITEEPERLFNLPHMTSMDLLIKNATVIGDSNLRCYPSPVIVPRSGLFTAPVITEHYEDDEDEESSSTAETEVLEELEVLQSDDEEITTNTAVQSSESLVMKSSQSIVKQTLFEFETVVFEVEVEADEHDEDEEDEEAAELRELLESMSDEERSEFLRLSNQETMRVAPLVSTA